MQPGDEIAYGGAGENVEGLVTVTEALERYFARLPDDVAHSAYAATAWVLAAHLDDREAAAYAVAAASKELREVLAKIEAMAPTKTSDGIDDITRARARRRAAAS